MKHFLIIEMMLHALDFLIGLVPFTGNKHHISFLGHHAGCANGLLTVDNRDDLSHLLFVQSRKHIVDDILRFFKSGIVTGNDNLVTLSDSFLCHEWTFALIAISPCTTNGNHMPFAIEYFVYGVEHICQCIGCMSIVDNCL